MNMFLIIAAIIVVTGIVLITAGIVYLLWKDAKTLDTRSHMARFADRPDGPCIIDNTWERGDE